MEGFWIDSFGISVKSALLNLKFAILLGAILFALCSSAQAQPTGKIFRIGFLDNSTVSGSAVLVDALRQELEQAWVDRGKEHHHRVPICRAKDMSACRSLRRSWFV